MTAGASDGPRLPRLTPDRLAPDQQALHEAIAGGRRTQGPHLFRLRGDDDALEGPFNGFLLAPRLGQALQELGSAVRYGTSLSDRAREIAILLVAAHEDSAFERYAHEAVGRHVGLTDAELAGLRELDPDVLTDPDEQTLARTTVLLLEDGDLDDEAYAQAVDVLGLPALFELLTLVGYYATLGLQLRVFRVPVPRE